MNERYLFRGKRQEMNDNGRHSWQTGYYCVDTNGLNIITTVRGREYSVDANTISQCTGLRDKNSALIFEGDIVNEYITIIGGRYEGVDVPPHIDAMTAQVIFKNGAFMLESAGDGATVYHLADQSNRSIKLEVIGNIYDNLELLEVPE